MSKISNNRDAKHSDFVQGALASVVDWFQDLPNWIKYTASSFFLYLVFCMVSQMPAAVLFESSKNAVTDIVNYSRKDQDALRQEKLDYNAFLRNALEKQQERTEKLEQERSKLVENLNERLSSLEERHKNHK